MAKFISVKKYSEEIATVFLNLTTSKDSDNKNEANLQAYFKEVFAKTKANPFDGKVRVYKDIGMFEIYKFRGMVHLSSIDSFEPGQGYGNEMMKFLTELADKHKVTMDLDPKPYGNKYLNTQQLKKMYKKFGFKNSEDYGMIRVPK